MNYISSAIQSGFQAFCSFLPTRLPFSTPQISPQDSTIAGSSSDISLTGSASPTDTTAALETYLRIHGSDQQISSYLCLETWQTTGKKSLAKQMIIECFRSQSPMLNLNALGLSSLPRCMLCFSWLHILLLYNNPRLLDFSFLQHLKNLSYLDCSNTGIISLQYLSSCTQLEHLILRQTRVHNISSLQNMHSLQNLVLENSLVNDVSPLDSLENLYHLDLRETQIPSNALHTTLSNLLSRHRKYKGSDPATLIDAEGTIWKQGHSMQQGCSPVQPLKVLHEEDSSHQISTFN
jgi:hypothetical protein